MHCSSSAKTEAFRGACSAHIASDAARAPEDERPCCTSSRCRRCRDKKPAPHRPRSSAPALQSCRGLHTQKICPGKWGTPEEECLYVRKSATPCRDAVRSCIP